MTVPYERTLWHYQQADTKLINDILKVIRKLDPNKAHGLDKISIRMLKLSDKAIMSRNRSFPDPLEKI